MDSSCIKDSATIIFGVKILTRYGVDNIKSISDLQRILVIQKKNMTGFEPVTSCLWDNRINAKQWSV